MADRFCLLIVSDYLFVNVGGRLFAEIPWDQKLASLYCPPFAKVLLLGRLRRLDALPPGWFPVDPTFFEVMDAGDWATPMGFLARVPAIWARLGAEWERVSVLHLKLFYLTSLLAWWYNWTRSRNRRRPVATLLVGDAAEAVLLRRDLLGPR